MERINAEYADFHLQPVAFMDWVRGFLGQVVIWAKLKFYRLLMPTEPSLLMLLYSAVLPVACSWYFCSLHANIQLAGGKANGVPVGTPESR